MTLSIIYNLIAHSSNESLQRLVLEYIDLNLNLDGKTMKYINHGGDEHHLYNLLINTFNECIPCLPEELMLPYHVIQINDTSIKKMMSLVLFTCTLVSFLRK